MASSPTSTPQRSCSTTSSPGHIVDAEDFRPRVVIGIPSGITGVERRAVRDSALHAGAREVYLIEEPIAAAIGAGLPVSEPGGNLIVDIGGGTTEVAIISFGGVVYCESVRIAGEEMDDAIIQYIRKHYNLLVGERQAEEIKVSLASALSPSGEPRRMEVKGRDLVDGLPKSVVVTDKEIYEAVREPVATIVETVRACLDRTPSDLAGDIVDTGIVPTLPLVRRSGPHALVRGQRAGTPKMNAYLRTARFSSLRKRVRKRVQKALPSSLFAASRETQNKGCSKGYSVSTAGAQARLNWAPIYLAQYIQP